ncbi:MaoC family dehydratase [Virgibacillus litoralis]|uniref:Acyl dehydratase n=1 Tax=Virgibacillus litoralis TaxID=578221 RepID=A0ABS4H854_9BACI|nr:MaoC family dehydratase [Virgibacillus litoralis]MBP1947086.1 acyl dehydratase [Virgibacillus litoralis]
MAEIHTPFGRVYEDFNVGDLIMHWPGRTITDADDTIFSLLALNQHPLHIDSHYAAQSQFGKNLVNGTLVFSIAVGMTVNDISGAAIAMLEYENIKHLAPTFRGDTLYGSTKILDKRESKSKIDRGIVYVETVVTNQREEDVMSYRRRLLIPKREFASRPYTHR